MKIETTLREAMQQALEALKSIHRATEYPEIQPAITTLRAALEQSDMGIPITEKQAEPVAWMFQHEETGRIMCVEAQQVEGGFEKGNPRLKKITPLYTAPPQQQAEPVGTAKDLFTNAALERLDIRPSTKVYLDAPPQRQPLTDAEIEATFLTCNGKWDGDQWVIEDADFHPFARALEAAHGIIARGNT